MPAMLAPLMPRSLESAASNNAVVFARPPTTFSPTPAREKEVHAEDTSFQNESVQGVWERLKLRNMHESEYLQAVAEVLETMQPVFEKHPKYLSVFERMAEPERMIMFRVPWVDDSGNTRVNRGFR
eukprot:scaffold654711_cov42-Prasinocladus_malaysianus.AAC.1